MRAARVFVPVVVILALMQALSVAGDPVPEVSFSFAGRVIGSVAALVVALWIAAAAALDTVDGRTPYSVGRRPMLLVWCAGLTVLAAVLAVLQPLLPVFAVVLALLVLPAVADGARTPVAAAVRTVRGSPARCAAALLVTFVIVVFGWLVALGLGFFVTGVVSAALTWLVLGMAAVAALFVWSSLYRLSNHRSD